MNADAEPGPDPLDAWHERRGAIWLEDAGNRLVERYGDPRAEREALARAVGVCDRRSVEAVDVRGEDRVRFLNAYVTCDVAALESGAGTPGFFTNAQGRILADATVSARRGSLRVAVPWGRAAALIEHLERYLLADRVELEPVSGRRQLALAGPGAVDLVAEIFDGELGAAVGSMAPAEVAGHEVEIQRARPLGAPVFVVWVGAESAGEVAGALTARGAVPVGGAAFEARRILAGVPRWGVDFDEANFPQETGLEDAISYTKGCYLGQEVVARIHYRGHVNHTLRGLRGAGTERPPVGASIELDGQQVGRLGSVTIRPETGEAVGLAILHRKAAEVGTRVSVGGSGPMQVERPGFAVTSDEEPVRQGGT